MLVEISSSENYTQQGTHTWEAFLSGKKQPDENGGEKVGCVLGKGVGPLPWDTGSDVFGPLLGNGN